MRHFLLVNASPRAKGTSAYLANTLREYLKNCGHAVSLVQLYPHAETLDALVHAFSKADTLVVLGPCYINTYPADTYALLEAIAKHPEACHGQRVYGVIQGGMPHAHTHACGLMTLDCFAKACGLKYGGGFVMGMGAMLNGQPLDKLLNAKKVKKQLDVFFGHVERGEASPDTVYQQAELRLPGFVWRLMARWINRVIDKEMKAHGIEKNQPSPYSLG